MQQHIEEPNTLALGREVLELCGGDLQVAYQQNHGLEAETLLAWLDREIRKDPANALELVCLAACAVDECNCN